jgi:chemotaxis protein MotA
LDVLTIIGLLAAFGGILSGMLLEGSKLASIIQLTAFLIVVGGTVGAVMIQYRLKIFIKALTMVRWVVLPPKFDHEEAIKKLMEWADMARKGGLLSLEPVIESSSDPFVKKGLQLMVDGSEPEMLRNTLMVELEARERVSHGAAKVYESAGGYAPTIGILGAVLGLIHVMANLADPSKLGEGIATAFVATVYGVGSANILFLPIANKLKDIASERSLYYELVIEGLLAIANGDHPRLIESRLRGYLAH